MSTSRLRGVALDFDLTLFDYANPEETRAVFPWFSRLAELGVHAGIASGRSLANLRVETGALGMSWADPFPRFVIEYECMVRQPSGDDFPGTERWNEQILHETQLLESHAVPLLEKVRDRALADGVEVVRDIIVEPGNATICLESPAATETARLALLRDLPARKPALEIRRNHHILIVALAGRNKGAALQQLQRAMGWRPSELLVVGDNLNDLSMMTPALGFQCATVGNADQLVLDAVRTRGGRIARSRISFGLIELFEQIFGVASPVAAKA